jgi:hypothetical protein
MKIKVTHHRYLNGQSQFIAGLYPSNEVEFRPDNSIVNRGAATKEQALEQLERSLIANARHGSYRKYLRSRTITWCLFYDDGWQYDMVHDNALHNHGGVRLSCKTCAEAIESMQAHFNQHEDNQPIADQIGELVSQ